MGVISKLFCHGDSLQPQAERLVSAAKVVATTSFVPLLNDFPCLRKCNVENWDFFATAAATCVGINNLLEKISADQFRSLYNAAILPELQRWSPQGQDAVLDCQTFIKRIEDANQLDGEENNTTLLATDALGMWVFWNLFQRQPADEESNAARAIGQIIASQFQDWWNADK